MTKALPARVEEYTALQAQSTFNKAEKVAFNDLQKYITTHQKETIMWYWELGQKVAKLYEAASDNKELYGKQFLKRIAIGLGYKTEVVLRSSMEVVETFGTKKAFTEYLRLRGEAGNMLQWSHIVYLCNIKDAGKRMELAAATLEQSWTAEELWQRVKALCEKTARGVRTPVAKIPNSANSCLTHVTSQASKFNFNYSHSWTGEAFDLVKTVKDIPADKLNDTFVESIQDTRKQIVDMQKNATELANQLSVVEADVQARIEAQAEINKQVAEAEAAEQDDMLDDAPKVVKPGKGPRVVKRKVERKKREGRVGV